MFGCRSIIPPNIAVPIHVEKWPRPVACGVLPKNRVTIEQQIHQILHDLVEGLVVLAFARILS